MPLRSPSTYPALSLCRSGCGHGWLHFVFALACISVLVALTTGSAQAQTPPDAGTLRQQIESERTTPLPAQRAPLQTPPVAPVPREPGPVLTVSAFRFSGNTLLSDAQLAPALASYLNRPLQFAELERAAQVVADTYRQAGWLARAFLPQQEIDAGIVTIGIAEARFGGVTLEGPAPTRIPLARLLAVIEAAQPVGAAVRLEAIDRALLLIDDLPGVSASASLAEGRKEGHTDLLIKFADTPLIAGELGVDNMGSRSTGRERVTANFGFNSAFGIGDQFSAQLSRTQGNDYARVALSMPLGNSGLRFGVNASDLSYKLVATEFRALNARGDSQASGIDLSYPLLRARSRNVFLSLNIDSKRFDNESGGVTTTRYKINSTTLGLNGNWFDGAGMNSAGFSFVEGKLDLAGSPNQSADAAGAQVAGRFSKRRYSATRQQSLSEALSVYAAFSGQSAGKNLDSAEKFYLGGASGVRAYPGNEGGGAEGHLVNLELRMRLPNNLSLAGFYDWGEVKVNRHSSFPGAATLNRYSLKGAGVAVSIAAPFGVNLKLSWARRIGENPNRTATGNDQDGSLLVDRFWLQAALPF